MGTTDIRELLVKEIKQSGKSISYISKKSGIGSRTIWHWLNDGMIPTIENAQCVLSVFGKELEIKEKEYNAE